MGFFSKDDSGITVEKAPADVVPRCPSCKQPLHTVWVKKQGAFRTTTLLICPHCQALMGFSTFNG